MTEDLFDVPDQSGQPLAARMRPRELAEYVGQDHILGPHKPLRDAVLRGQLHSMILWGPPGVGKTSLARLLSHHVQANFRPLSAVLAGVKDIREAVSKAQSDKKICGRKTVLFIDEVHRFNKSKRPQH